MHAECLCRVVTHAQAVFRAFAVISVPGVGCSQSCAATSFRLESDDADAHKSSVWCRSTVKFSWCLFYLSLPFARRSVAFQAANRLFSAVLHEGVGIGLERGVMLNYKTVVNIMLYSSNSFVNRGVLIILLRISPRIACHIAYCYNRNCPFFCSSLQGGAKFSQCFFSDWGAGEGEGKGKMGKC